MTTGGTAADTHRPSERRPSPGPAGGRDARCPTPRGQAIVRTACEVAALAVASCLLALLTSWPLAMHLRTHVPEIGLGDPLLQAWQVAWGGYALTHQPASFFQSNTFWPLRDTLAFSDALLGYAPIGLIGSGAQAALVRYNLLYLFADAFAFAGAFALARGLGVGVVGAAVAGASFAYAPWRLAQHTHLHVISSGGIPVSLLFLLHGYRNDRPAAILAGWLLATWQLSLGFTLGLQLAYALAVLVSVVAAAWLWRRRPAIRGAVLGASVVGISFFLLWGTIQAQPYLRVVRDHAEARRSVREVAFYSPPPRGLLAAPETSLLWGEPTRSVRESLNWPTEQALFPGLVTLLLAAIGLAAPGYPRRLRGTLVLAACMTALLSLGFAGPGGEYLYGSLYQLAPGWQAIRTPGRIATLTSLALAVLASIGAQRLVGSVAKHGSRGSSVPAAVPLTGMVLIGAVLAEGYGPVTLTRVPPMPENVRDAAEPRLDLPSDSFHDLVYMYWSTEDFPRLVNGHSGFVPRSLEKVRSETKAFPDERSAAFLQSIGVRTVIVHPELRVRLQSRSRRNPTGSGLAIDVAEDSRPVIYPIGP